MKRKNKAAEQAEKRRIRKEERRARRGTPLERKTASLTEKPTILIVCEGENTEPSYFKQFKLATAIVEAIGEGYNTLSLVKRATQLSEKEDYDQVWCVFDKDDFLAENFNNAIHLAKKYNFKTAYSNQAFEYWIILHFEDHQGGGMHRNRYEQKINAYLKEYGLKYLGKSEKRITESIFELLEATDEKTGEKRQTLAIERAKRNYQRFDHKNPALEESSSTVFNLVQELLKHC